MSTTVDNVFTNYEGTAVVDPVYSGDMWIRFEDGLSDLANQHAANSIAMDVQRVRSVKAGSKDFGLMGPGMPKTPSEVFNGGFYFSHSNCGIGGFRGVPRYATTQGGSDVAILGNLPLGDGKAPAITRMIQEGWLPSKSIGEIEGEMRDFNRWSGALQNYKGSARRPN